MPQFTRQTEFGPVTLTAPEGTTEGEIQDMVAEWAESMRPPPEEEPPTLAGARVLLDSPPIRLEEDAPRGPDILEQLPEEPPQQPYVPGVRAEGGRPGITVFGPSDAPAEEWAEAATGRLVADIPYSAGPGQTFLQDPAFHEQVTQPALAGVPGAIIGAAQEAGAVFTGEESRSEQRLAEGRAKLMRRMSDDDETNIILQSVAEDWDELTEIFGGAGGPSVDETEIEGTFGFQIPPDATPDDIRALIQSKKVGRDVGREMMGSFKAAMNYFNPELAADATLSPEDFHREAFLFWASDPVEAALEATWVLPGLDPISLAFKGIMKGGGSAVTGVRLLANANKIRRRSRQAYRAEGAHHADVGAQRAQGGLDQSQRALEGTRAEVTARIEGEIPRPPPLQPDMTLPAPHQSPVQAEVNLGAANIGATMLDDAAAAAARNADEVLVAGERRISEIGDEITEVRQLDLLDEAAPPKRPEEPSATDASASPDQAARDASDVIAHDIVHGDGGKRQALERSNSGAANANAVKNADMEAFFEFVQDGLDLMGDGRMLAEMPPVQRVTFLERAKQLAESGFVVKDAQTGKLIIDGNEVEALIDAVLDKGRMPSSVEQLAMARYARQVGEEVVETGLAWREVTESIPRIKDELVVAKKAAKKKGNETALDGDFRAKQDELTNATNEQTRLGGVQDGLMDVAERAKLGAKRAGTLAAQMLNERKMPIHRAIGEDDFLAAATVKNKNEALGPRKRLSVIKGFEKVQTRIDRATKSLDEAESSLGRARSDAVEKIDTGAPAADAAAAQTKANKAKAVARKKARTAISKAERELERARKAADKAVKKAQKLEARRAAKEQKALARELKKEEVARLREEQKAIKEEIKQAGADHRKADSIASKAQKEADRAAARLEKDLEKIARVEERALEKARKAEQVRMDRARSKRAKDIADQDPAVQSALSKVTEARKRLADAQSAKLIAYDLLSEGPAGIVASTIMKAASTSTLMTTSAEWSYLGMQFSGGIAWATLLETGLFAKSGFKGRVPGTTAALTTREAWHAMFSPARARRVAAGLRENPKAALYDDLGVSFKTVEDIAASTGDEIEEMMRAYSKMGFLGAESRIPGYGQIKGGLRGMLRRSNNAIALSGNIIRYSLMDIFSASGMSKVELERIANLVNLSTGTFEFRPKMPMPGSGLSPGMLSGYAKAEKVAVELGSNFLIAPKLYASVIKRPWVVGGMLNSGSGAVRNAALTYMGMSALRTMGYGTAAYLAARFYDGLSEDESWMRANLAMWPGSFYEGKLTMGDEQWGLDGGTTGTLSSVMPSIGISGQEHLNAVERLNYWLEDPDFDYSKLKLLGNDYATRMFKGMVKYKLHPAYGAIHDALQGETFYGAELKQEDFKSKQAYWFNRLVLPIISAYTPFTGQSLTKSAIGQMEQARGITDPSQSEFIGKNDAHLLKSPLWMFALKTVLEPFGFTSSISRHKIDEKKKRKGAAPRVPRSRGLGGSLGGGGLGGGL